jgi:hypothetical protein
MNVMNTVVALITLVLIWAEVSDVFQLHARTDIIETESMSKFFLCYQIYWPKLFSTLFKSMQNKSKIGLFRDMRWPARQMWHKPSDLLFICIHTVPFKLCFVFRHWFFSWVLHIYSSDRTSSYRRIQFKTRFGQIVTQWCQTCHSRGLLLKTIEG